jgi:hypothetical protein
MQSTTASITVAKMQEETDCRVHIERSRCEVRLFGDARGVRQASERIDELASQCIEAFVPLDGSSKLPDEQLQNLAYEHHVTFIQETRKIVAYGLKGPVSKAVVSLQEAIASRLPEAADVSSPEEHSSKRSVAEENRDQAAIEGLESSRTHFLPSTVLAAVPPQAILPQSKEMPGHLNIVAGRASQQGARGAVMQQPFFAQANAATCRSGHLQCCPTCGAARFCTECGAPVGDCGEQDAPPITAADSVHWQHRQPQQPNPPAGRRGGKPAKHHGGGARAKGKIEMDLQTAPWLPPQMVMVPYDCTMAMQGTAAHCSPGMLPVAFVSMEQWLAATGPGQMDTRVLMAPTTMFAGQPAPVDANTVSPQSSVCEHPSEESLPWPEQSVDSLPPMR